MDASAPQFVVGLFVGGASKRMGRPKGLLEAPDQSGQTLVTRLLGEIKRALPEAACVLVGQRSAYEAVPLVALADAASGCGPLGGLVALLRHAESVGADSALCVACDLPFLEGALLQRLAEEATEADIYCPHVDGRYQPLVARYRVALRPSFEVALGERRLALQPLLRGANTVTMTLSEHEERTLVDWDTPEDAGLR